MNQWKAAKKHKVLQPFAWVYQSFRITGIFVKKGIGPESIMKQREKGLEQRKLIEKLGLKVEKEIE